MKLGVIVTLNESVNEELKKLRDNGFSTCQLCCWKPSLLTEEFAKAVNEAVAINEITVTAFWCGWSGPAVWNFYEGPVTLGLVPPAYRFLRMEELKRGSDFAKKIHVTDIATHMGFLPENPHTSEYAEVVSAIKNVAEYCKDNDQFLLFETGQETPVTLKRTIEDVGTDNLGINFDPANLILYGKANPIDALDIVGEYVRNIHGKDGCYPTDGKHLGEEKPVGQGCVNYPEFIKKLKKIGYSGPITIEREISGKKQLSDILSAKMYIEELWSKC